jgi:hypothetical protein
MIEAVFIKICVRTARSSSLSRMRHGAPGGDLLAATKPSWSQCRRGGGRDAELPGGSTAALTVETAHYIEGEGGG